MSNVIQEWLKAVMQSEKSWQGNNLHIDEIENFYTIKRDEWIESSLKMYGILLEESIPDSLMPFLHIALSDSETILKISNVSLDWLRFNINEFTPPSFHFTSKEYFSNFYKYELVSCHPDRRLVDLIGTKLNVTFYYRNYFDQRENLFSREIYVFALEGIYKG